MEFDCSHLEVKAVVDWVAFAVRVKDSTNGQTIRRHAGIDYADPLDKGAGGAATTFALRLQDPPSYRAAIRWFASAIARLKEHGHQVEPIGLHAIEVSTDYQPTFPNWSELDLADVVHHLVKFLAYPPSNNRRLYREKGAQVFDLPCGLHEHDKFTALIRDGYMCGVGDKTDDVYVRAYLKNHDGGKPLSSHKHRARIEQRIQGEALRLLGDPSKLKFTKLAKGFHLRKLQDGLAPLGQLHAQASGQLGGQHRIGKDGRPRQHSKLTVADTAANSRIFEALRQLERDWKA